MSRLATFAALPAATVAVTAEVPAPAATVVLVLAALFLVDKWVFLWLFLSRRADRNDLLEYLRTRRGI